MFVFHTTTFQENGLCYVEFLTPHRPLPDRWGFSFRGCGNVAELRAAVVVDYQNVHLTGRGLVAVSRHRPAHESLIDPLHFANQLIATRNCRQREGMDHAVLAQVLVYRGEPSVEHDPKRYAGNQAQKVHWQRDPRVLVTLRPRCKPAQLSGHHQI